MCCNKMDLQHYSYEKNLLFHCELWEASKTTPGFYWILPDMVKGLFCHNLIEKSIQSIHALKLRLGFSAATSVRTHTHTRTEKTHLRTTLKYVGRVHSRPHIQTTVKEKCIYF